MTATPLTVIVPTLNEELHIRGCLDSVAWASERFVVDSLSTDGTRDVAAAAGAVVAEHQWEGYAAQKNWALDNLPISNEWVLMLDADEQPDDDLRRAIQAVIESGGNADGYYLNRLVIFMGRTLRHAYHYPDPTLRLFRRGRARFDERRAHERMVVDGPTARLDGDLMHRNVKDLHEFLDRHNRYSTLEAQDRMDIVGGRQQDAIQASFRGDPAERRRAQKNIWIRLPLFTRPQIRFLHAYIWRRGFLDGMAGFVYCLLISCYEMHIDAKTWEQRQRHLAQ